MESADKSQNPALLKTLAFSISVGLLSFSLVYILGITSQLARSSHFRAQELAPSNYINYPASKTIKREMPRKLRSNWQLDLSAGTGIVVFQDIQVPMDSFDEARADGKSVPPELEFKDHFGVPVGFSLGLRRFPLPDSVTAGRGRSFPTVGFIHEGQASVLHGKALHGPTQTQSASLSRWQAWYQLNGYQKLGSGLIWQVGPRIQMGRTGFNNASSGHSIQASLIGGNLTLRRLLHWTLSAYGLYGFDSSFYYNPERSMFGGEKFQNASIEHFQYGVSNSIALTESAWVDLSGELQHANVYIENIETYEGFGLDVSRAGPASRQLPTRTIFLNLGLRKSVN